MFETYNLKNATLNNLFVYNTGPIMAPLKNALLKVSISQFLPSFKMSRYDTEHNCTFFNI